jgi:hypothetical protein
MASHSEDVVVRCYGCAKIMSLSFTVRSGDERDLEKIVWMLNNRVRCAKCVMKST